MWSFANIAASCESWCGKTTCMARLHVVPHALLALRQTEECLASKSTRDLWLMMKEEVCCWVRLPRSHRGCHQMTLVCQGDWALVNCLTLEKAWLKSSILKQVSWRRYVAMLLHLPIKMDSENLSSYRSLLHQNFARLHSWKRSSEGCSISAYSNSQSSYQPSSWSCASLWFWLVW